jgi:zinc transport system substrate-binding protein
VLSVVTGLWPLGQLVSMIGGDKVAVDDVVPPGSDPITYEPGATAADAIRSAGLVLEVGGGFQPGIERAAAGASSVTEVGPLGHTGEPYVWLDPPTMQKVVTAVVAAMAAADPQAAPLFKQNGPGVAAQLQSLGIDFSSTFAACPGTTIITPDSAFSAMAADYGLHDTVVGPRPAPAAISSIVSGLPSNGVTAGLTEPWVDSSGVTEVAAAGHFKTTEIETLVSAPDGVPAAADNYFSQMEQVLNQVSAALGCNTQEQ